MRGRVSSKLATPGARPFLVVCVVVFILMIGQTLNRLWSTPDFWVYLGAVREFAQRPLHPLHPLLVGNDADPYMGPYTYVLGLLVRVGGLDAVNVLAIAGLMNLALLFAGIWALARRLSLQPLAPVFTLLFTLVAWGWAPWRWSGYFNLNSIGSGLALGSTFASGLGLLTLAAFIEWLRSEQHRHLWMLVLGYPVVVLTHQMTGLWVGLIGLGIAIGSAEQIRRRRRIVLTGAAVVAGLLIIMWPFFSVLDLLATTGDFDGINSRTYRRVAIRSFLAAPGLAILAARLFRRRRDPLALAGLAVALVFVFGWATDRGSLGRVFPGLMLTAHIAMADWFATRVKPTWGSHRARTLVRASAIVIVLIGVAGTATGWIRGIPRAVLPARLANDERLKSAVEPYLSFADLIPPDAVVAAPGSVSLSIGAYTAKVIGSTIPAPFVIDNDQRLADVAVILDPFTPATQRLDLMAKYRCDWLVIEEASANALIRDLPGAEIVGTRAGYTIIRLTTATDSPALQSTPP